MSNKKPILLKFRHYGVPFTSNAHAKLVFTGMFHHYVMLTP